MAAQFDARLAKDGRRILCGRQDCGRELAGVALTYRNPRRALSNQLRIMDGVWNDEIEQWLIEDALPLVRVNPGWRVDAAGVWSLTRRAMELVKAGKPPRFRRDAPMVKGFDDIVFGQQHWDIPPRDLPIDMRCPRCRGVNRIAADLLEMWTPNGVASTLRG